MPSYHTLHVSVLALSFLHPLTLGFRLQVLAWASPTAHGYVKRNAFLLYYSAILVQERFYEDSVGRRHCTREYLRSKTLSTKRSVPEF